MPYGGEGTRSYGVRDGDAGHVGVLHTNGCMTPPCTAYMRLGSARAWGTSDWYFNGGQDQDCYFPSCSRLRAVDFFATAAINPGFLGKECPTEVDCPYNNPPRLTEGVRTALLNIWGSDEGE